VIGTLIRLQLEIFAIAARGGRFGDDLSVTVTGTGDTVIFGGGTDSLLIGENGSVEVSFGSGPMVVPCAVPMVKFWGA